MAGNHGISMALFPRLRPSLGPLFFVGRSSKKHIASSGSQGCRSGLTQNLAFQPRPIWDTPATGFSGPSEPGDVTAFSCEVGGGTQALADYPERSGFPAFHSKAIFPSVPLLHLLKHLIGRIAEASTSHSNKASRLQLRLNRCVIPHPEMLRIAKPCAG